MATSVSQTSAKARTPVERTRDVHGTAPLERLCASLTLVVCAVKNIQSVNLNRFPFELSVIVVQDMIQPGIANLKYHVTMIQTFAKMAGSVGMLMIVGSTHAIVWMVSHFAGAATCAIMCLLYVRTCEVCLLKWSVYMHA